MVKNLFGINSYQTKAQRIFDLVSKQRRGGRKLLFAFVSHPTSGMDNYHAIWWPTIRGTDNNAMKLMEAFVNTLAKEITAEVPRPKADLTPEERSNLIKETLLSDIGKTVKEKLTAVGELTSYSVVTNGDAKEFTLVVSLNIQNDSGLNDSADIKPNIPFGFNPPKAEATQTERNEPEVDSDGFWISSGDEGENGANQTNRGKCFLY